MLDRAAVEPAVAVRAVLADDREQVAEQGALVAVRFRVTSLIGAAGPAAPSPTSS